MNVTIEHPSLESSFGHLLTMALKECVDVGHFKGRRFDDLLFHEYDITRDGDFSGWVLNAMCEIIDGEQVLMSRMSCWPLMIIQAATYSRNPELIAAILQAEIDYELDDIAANEWQDEHGNPVELPAEAIEDDQRAVMSWPSNWRRVFGEETPAA
jgi:hypothetical protein